jgi:acetate kinase
VIDNLNDIQAVGHRVVHGGEHFKNSVLIDKDAKEKLKELIALAPLHNPANIM